MYNVCVDTMCTGVRVQRALEYPVLGHHGHGRRRRAQRLENLVVGVLTSHILVLNSKKKIFFSFFPDAGFEFCGTSQRHGDGVSWARAARVSRVDMSLPTHACTHAWTRVYVRSPGLGNIGASDAQKN